MHICVLSLTCSVDHALGCCCRSGENVGCAASSGCSTSGGGAHSVDWQATRWWLFNWNHNTPVRDETQRHEINLHTQYSLLNAPQWYLGSACWSVPAVCKNIWEDEHRIEFSRYLDDSAEHASMFTVGLCQYNNTKNWVTEFPNFLGHFGISNLAFVCKIKTIITQISLQIKCFETQHSWQHQGRIFGELLGIIGSLNTSTSKSIFNIKQIYSYHEHY